AALDDLFGDGQPTTTSARPLDLDVGTGGTASDAPAEDPFAAATQQGPQDDPFASVPDNPNMSKPGEIGEQTRFFIAQAGVNKRNPPWKIALFIAAGLGLPAGILYMLSQLHIVPLEITQVDAETGEQVSTPIFSGDGLSGLRDKLLGKTPVLPPKPSGTRVASAKKQQSADDKPLIEKKQIDPKLTKEQIAAAADLYRNDDRRQVGPEVRKDAEKIAVDSGAGLDQKVIGETFAKNIKAFQTCNENEIRRNPAFKGGKVSITFTIGPSGTVTRAAVDRADIDKSTLGECLKDKAKRVVFPSFQGDAFDVEIPLVLTKGS
ncbi:MAG: AgmX/PglI C-terminal domain-containing protein, partial [Myxococcales bacterium]